MNTHSHNSFNKQITWNGQQGCNKQQWNWEFYIFLARSAQNKCHTAVNETYK